jgi:metal-dependent amidase/aminoacylase/carboxypeptidase family protein
MINEGVLEEGRLGPRVDAVYGIHLWSPRAVGVIECSEGPVMANSDRYRCCCVSMCLLQMACVFMFVDLTSR